MAVAVKNGLWVAKKKKNHQPKKQNQQKETKTIAPAHHFSKGEVKQWFEIVILSIKHLAL